MELFSQEHLLNIVHLFAFAMWFGTLIYVTFISGVIMFKNMTRTDFSNLQAKLFPAYFLIGDMCGFVLLVTYFFLHPFNRERFFDYNNHKEEVVKISTLIAMLVINFFEGAVVGPWCTGLMFKRMRAGKSFTVSRC